MDILEERLDRELSGTLELDQEEYEAQEEEEWSGKQEWDEIPAQTRQDIQSLLMLGYLQDTVTIWGREFEMKTLNTGEELQVGLVTRQHNEGLPLEQGRAYASAIVAASLMGVDGTPIAMPIKEGENILPRKYKWVLKLHWPVTERLYQEYLTLERRAVEALDEFEKKSSGADTPLDSPDLLENKDSLQDS